jgi:hypothetical protein
MDTIITTLLILLGVFTLYIGLLQFYLAMIIFKNPSWYIEKASVKVVIGIALLSISFLSFLYVINKGF